ncbi:MAG: beta-1,3-glucanase family protein [Actinomycetota bacterium]|nr:beta-1,3-glucanase family protein [Actinomycetota bacterium]
MGLGRRCLACATAGLIAFGTIAWVGETAQAANVVDLPMTVANSSGLSAPMYVTMVGHINDASGVSSPEGYLDANGTFHVFPTGSVGTPSPAPDVSIAGPVPGTASIVDIPFGFSGRMYYSFGAPVGFRLVVGTDGRNGLVQPVPWDPNAFDSQIDVDFDFIELSYSPWGLYLNSTQVDGMVIPASVGVTDSGGNVMRSGVTVESMSSIAATLAGIPGFENAVQTNGGVLRLVSPAKLVESDRMEDDYLQPYLDNVWAKYAGGSTLTVQPWEEQPAKIFTGTVVNGKFVFKDTSGAVVAQLDQPTTADVWRCDGALASPNNDTIGPITRSLCADLNRGTLGSQPVSPAADPATYYRPTERNEGLFNHYSAVVHEAMRDGHAYGFAFDDVAHQESLVHASSPVAASFDVLPRATGGPGITGSATGIGGTPTNSGATSSGTAAGTRELTINLITASPGYAYLTLGAGTTSGQVTIAVDGGTPATASVLGAGTSRVDFKASAGTHTVVVVSSGKLGDASLQVPGSGTTTAPSTDVGMAATIPGVSTVASGADGSREVTINLATASPGYAYLTLGAGSTAGQLTISVDGNNPRTASVLGAGTSRVDLVAGPGTHVVTVTSTGMLGDLSIDVPGSSPAAAPSSSVEPQPIPTSPTGSGAQQLTVDLSAPSPGYAWITLPVGTTPGVVTVTVNGVSATIAVLGPTTARVDFAAAAGTHVVTVTSTGSLGLGTAIQVG